MFYIVVVSCILEITTKRKLKLLLHDFTWKKSEYMAKGSADLLASLYFIVSLLVLLYNVYIKNNAPENYAFWKWLIIMLPLTIIFRIIYYKFTGKDFSKKGFHHD